LFEIDLQRLFFGMFLCGGEFPNIFGNPISHGRRSLYADIDPKMIVHLVDGTYELFRHFYGLRRFTKGKDRPYGAVVGVLQTVLQMIDPVKGSASWGLIPAQSSESRGQRDTYLGVATDRVIESFRNRLWARYRTGAGIEPALLAQFHPLEEALAGRLAVRLCLPRRKKLSHFSIRLS
jgi:hypothetical protein